MAYYNNFNAGNQAYQQPWQQNYVPQPAPQSNPVITINTKEEALYYPVGPGNSVIFRKEDGTSMFIKTMGYSASEPPIFEEYVRAIEKPVQNESDDFRSEIDKLWGEVNALKTRQKPQNNKRREDGDT